MRAPASGKVPASEKVPAGKNAAAVGKIPASGNAPASEKVPASGNAPAGADASTDANAVAASALAEELALSGMTDLCLCPGSRSTPMVLALGREAGIRTWVVTDERSAGFFALGMARQSGRAVGILCTSGTAAANLLPAVVEAFFSQVPLVVMTADRPPELRDCGAPQTIQQAGLFGGHVRWSADVAVPDEAAAALPYYRTVACRAVATAMGQPQGPVHLNLPFREPLIAETQYPAGLCPGRAQGPWTAVYHGTACLGDSALDALARRLAVSERGLVVCGPRAGSAGAAASIERLAERLGWPILADPLSGLRYGSGSPSMVDSYDVLLRSEAFSSRFAPAALLRFGAVPISKPLQEFLACADLDCDLLVAEPGTWPDPLLSATDLARGDTRSFCEGMLSRLAPRAQSEWLGAWQRMAAVARAALCRQLEEVEEMFEGRVVFELFRRLRPPALVYVGNSMPLRDLDTFAGGTARGWEVAANRGASGIDGLLSSALGAAALRESPVVLIVGDLSFLHDTGGLQVAARHRLNLSVILVNNDGGGIFSFLAQARLVPQLEGQFATPHGLDLEPVARMAGGRFRRADTWDAFAAGLEQGSAQPGVNILELPSDRAHNRVLHERLIDRAVEVIEAELDGAGSR